MNQLKTYRHDLFKSPIKPRNTDTEICRREMIVNLILVSFSAITLVSFLLSIGYKFVEDDHGNIVSIASNTIFLAMLLTGWRFSRRGRYQVAAYIIIGLLVLTTFQLTFAYGFELPIAALLFALSIVVAGILVSTRAALITTGLLAVTLVAIAYSQVTNQLHPDVDWQDLGFQTGDAVGFVAILSIIGVISWLANREIDRSLQRSKATETALKLERDGLEIKVIERTRKLEESQLLRTMELQRFAEFGRLSANLLHEVASPLTAASLNLEQFSGRRSLVVEQAQQNLQQIERYVAAARKQLQNESSRVRFSVKSELSQIINLILPLARSQLIELNVNQAERCWLYGDPVKFNQLLGNLLVNAIDAYKDTKRPAGSKQIEVKVTTTKKFVTISVTDWGAGIESKQIGQVFQPFYTTKASSNRGIGIGLAMVKQFVEDEFHGTISVTNSSKKGTCFIIKINRAIAVIIKA